MSKVIKVTIEESGRVIDIEECSFVMMVTGIQIGDIHTEASALVHGVSCPSEVVPMVGSLVRFLLNGGVMSQKTRDKLRKEMKEELEKVFQTETAE